MRVATVQFCPTFKDKAANLQRAAQLVIQAAKAGARLVVLPELCTTGYSFMNFEEAVEFAEHIDLNGTTFQLFKSIAQELNIYLVWGMLEQDPGTKELHNSQVCIDPAGSWYTFRKINFFGNDYLWATSGRSNPPIIEMRLSGNQPGDSPSPMDKFVTRKLGMLICRDIRDKKDSTWKSFYEKGDADIVALSANWGDGGFPATAWMDFAKDNDCILIVSNRYGKEIPNDFGEGGVCVIWPDGKVVCEGLVWDSDCIVYAEV